MLHIKRVKKIVLIVLAVVIVALTACSIYFWDYIKAFTYAVRYSDNDIAQMIDDNDKALEDVLKDYPGVRAPDKQELDELDKGNVTQDELVDKIVGEQKQQKPTDTTTPPEKPVDNTDYDTLITTQITKMYVLKSYYLGQLSKIEKSIINDFNSMTEEQKTTSAKQKIIMSYYSKGTSLESECDTKVEQVLTELKRLLIKAGRDTSLVDSIRSAYNDEKTLKKAYYMSIYTG